MKGVKNYRGFEASYLGASNRLSGRVRIRDLRFRKSIIVPYITKSKSGAMYEDIEGTVLEFLKLKGVKVVGKCESKDGYVFFTNNFENEIKEEL